MSTKYTTLSESLEKELRQIARSLSKPGCGILAADETPTAMADRFKNIDIENNAEMRRQCRQLLFTCCKEDLAPLSGVILHHETLYQTLDNGVPMLTAVKELDIIPGVTVDQGCVPLPGHPGEVLTQGLAGLDDRCREYRRLGCQFAKWRMVISIGQDIPSVTAIEEGARGMAIYAAICQRNGLVPIVEPDIGRAGVHDLDRCQKVTETVLAAVYKALWDHHVYLEGTVLKPNMVTSGSSCPTQAGPAEVALSTITALSRRVPCCVPGIFFLSGGQTEQMATNNLNEIGKLSSVPRPWHLSFCFGRALQDGSKAAWRGREENVELAQKVFVDRVKENGKAILGQCGVDNSNNSNGLINY